MTTRSQLAIGAFAAFALTSAALASRPVPSAERVSAIDLSDAPAAVQQAVRRHLAGAEPRRVEKIRDEGATKYEVDYMRAEGKASVTLTELGELLEIEGVVPAASIPAAILAEIERDYPGARVVQAEAVQRFYYELELEVDGREFEIAALATGDIEDGLLGDEEDDGPDDPLGDDDEDDD